MKTTEREYVARTIYMTHWKPTGSDTRTPGAPQWEQASDHVREWVLAQADAAIRALDRYRRR